MSRPWEVAEGEAVVVAHGSGEQEPRSSARTWAIFATSSKENHQATRATIPIQKWNLPKLMLDI